MMRGSERTFKFELRGVNGTPGAILPVLTQQEVTSADPVIARAFASWRARRASAGRRVTLIDLYALVARERGVEPHEVDRAERTVLAQLAFGVIWPGFETIPGSERGFEPVVIVPYGPEWPARFERWRDRIASVLGARALSIEHVGSTSVPGLLAKPIVDSTRTPRAAMPRLSNSWSPAGGTIRWRMARRRRR